MITLIECAQSFFFYNEMSMFFFANEYQMRDDETVKAVFPTFSYFMPTSGIPCTLATILACELLRTDI